VCKKEDY
jgi:hypothetical protein